MSDPQDEVRWVLQTIADAWPGDFGEESIVRIDRDEPLILETGTRTRSVELSRHAAIGASLNDRARTAIGTEFDADVETVIDVRIEGLHESEHGTIESKREHTRHWQWARHALDTRRTYPTIDPDAPDIGRVHYEDFHIDQTDALSSEYRDHYRTDLTVRLAGKTELPDT